MPFQSFQCCDQDKLHIVDKPDEKDGGRCLSSFWCKKKSNVGGGDGCSKALKIQKHTICSTPAPIRASPPPPSPPLPPPPPPMEIPPGCCNLNYHPYGIMPHECCDHETLTIRSYPESAKPSSSTKNNANPTPQMMSFRWCYYTADGKRASSKDANKVPKDAMCREPPKISPPPPPPSPPPVKAPPGPPIAPGCCNPNESPFGFESSQCCSTKTLLKKDGARCTSSMWCDDYYGSGKYDCVNALRRIKRKDRCKNPPESMPPPPLPPPTPSSPPASIKPGCCNPNSNIRHLITEAQCCHPMKLHIVGGVQCKSSRWCDDGMCDESLRKSPDLRCAADPPTVLPPPPPPPSPPPKVKNPPKPNPPGCCNANFDPYGYASTQCCDPVKLVVVEGAQCMSSRWCESGKAQGVDCLKATRTISVEKRCAEPPKTLPPPPSPPTPPSPSPPAIPKEFKPGCCNPNNIATGYSSSQCCEPGTFHVVEGKQCMTSRWCDYGSCSSYIRVAKHEQCDASPDPLPSPPASYPPPNPSSPPSAKKVKHRRGCCNANGSPGDIKEEGLCCDPNTNWIADGPQCTTSRWCDVGSCDKVLRIPFSETCKAPAPLHPPPPSPSLPPAKIPPARIPSGCCNPNIDESNIQSASCCDALTLRVVDGKQCTSSRWCDDGACDLSLKITKQAACRAGDRYGRRLLADRLADAADKRRPGPSSDGDAVGREEETGLKEKSTTDVAAALGESRADETKLVLCPPGAYVPFEGTITFGEVSGVPSQVVEYEGRYFCEPDPANEMTVAEFQAKSAMDGAASDGNDFIVLEELRVDASLHRRHEDDPEELGDHWIKVKFTGKVNLAPVGMRISAALTFDTEETGKVESVKLNADLSYRSPDGLINFDVGLQGTFGNCVSAEDSWFLKGSVVLAFPESGVTAEGTVDGVRYCEKNSEDIRGHSYAIDVTASVQYIPVEGVRLAVEDFAATMKGSQRPGDVDNGGRIVWTGVISATTSLSVEDGALEPAFFSNPGLSVSADIAVNIHKSTVKSVDFTVTNAEMTGDGWSVRLWTELISLPSKPGDKIIIHGEAKIDQVGRKEVVYVHIRG